jgi:N-acetylneuraminic acid mutarotase
MKSGEPDFIGRNLSIAVAINGKGYIGLGCDVAQTTNRMGFWEYDPSNDTWTQKTDFPSSFSADCGAFEYGNDLYVTGGVRLNPIGLSNQVYKYDVVNDTWSALPAFNGGAIAGHVTGSTGARAFVAGGYNSQIVTRNDVWEFSANTTGVVSVNHKNENIVFPNPASDFFTITSESRIESVQAFDVNGRLVINCHSGFEKISLENLNSGIYQLRIKYSDGSVGENRIVKSM